MPAGLGSSSEIPAVSTEEQAEYYVRLDAQNQPNLMASMAEMDGTYPHKRTAVALCSI